MSSNVKGVGFLLLSILVISLQSVAVKWMGSDYSALEIVFFRSLVALPATLLIFRYEGSRGLPTTKFLKLEIIRGVFLFLSYTTYMMGLAALPLADIEAIRFSGPMMITLLSVTMLGEKVKPAHWLALLVGFAGVLLIVKPGSASFNLGSVFVLISVLFYALMVVFTRKLQANDSSATMSFYSSLVYLVAALVLLPLPAIVGEVNNVHTSIAFLIRAWSLPRLLDLVIMFGLGLIWAAWMYFMSRAYSLAQASLIAPFEYLSLPVSIMWGFLFWQEVPTLLTLTGAFLTIVSGLFILRAKH